MKNQRFKEGQIIDKFVVKKNDKNVEIIIRYPKRSDLKQVLLFYNKVITETPFLSRITHVKFSEEMKWLSSIISRMQKMRCIQLFAVHNKKIVGSSSIEVGSTQVDEHVGNYGIAILQEYTGYGVGTRMSNSIIHLAKRYLHIEIVRLNVYSKNRIAKNMYHKLGFRCFGRLPQGMKRGNKYQDNIFMYKMLKQ